MESMIALMQADPERMIILLLSLALLACVYALVSRKRSKVNLECIEDIKSKLNILSVQLRTSMTSARWFSEMLLNKEYGKLNFAQLELIHEINDACAKGSDTVDSLMQTINNKSLKENAASADPAPSA